MEKAAGTQMTLQQALDLGVQHHQAGRLREAEGIYRQILTADPNNAQTLHLLGVLFSQVGQGEPAVDLIRRAIAQNPTAAQYHCNLGAAQAIAGRHEEAIESYERALVLQPDLLDAHVNLGSALIRLGRFDRAVESLRTALKARPNDFKILDSLGSALSQAGRQDEAIEVLKRALAIRADFAPTHLTLGNALVRSNRFPEAITAYRAALALRPSYPEAMNGLAQLLCENGSTDEAIDLARRAITLQEKSAPAWYTLGRALHKQNRHEESAHALRRAIAIDPNFLHAQNELGNVLVDLKSYREAIDTLQQSLKIEDSGKVRYNLGTAYWESGKTDEAIKEHKKAESLGFAEPMLFNNLGAIYHQRGELENAVKSFHRALEIDAGFDLARFNLGMVQLLKGNFKEGFANYESRWKAKSIPLPPRYNQRGKWDGSDLQGKRILLDCEQGFGDSIQFVRYVPMIAGRGGKPILAATPELFRLLKTVPCLDKIVCPPEEIPPFDVQCPLMSLAHLLHTTKESIPANVPYVFADPALVERWRTRLPRDSRIKVGLCWSGNPKHKEDATRSLPLASLTALGDLENAWFCGLQKGPASREAASPPGTLQLADWTGELTDFAETAALIAGLDLVIACDTAVAHLAGAMGKPIWLLIPKVPDWRWMLDRDDSPWYPTMRIFRQEKHGEWRSPVDRVIESLRNYDANTARFNVAHPNSSR
jgi:tetratricopeptide (TPR) repeat protein